MKIRPAPEVLADEVLEMVNAGIVQATVMHDIHRRILAAGVSQSSPAWRWPGAALREGQIALMVRRTAPNWWLNSIRSWLATPRAL